MTFEELMKDFASVLGSEAFAPGMETETCVFDFDGNEVTFAKDPQAEAVVMTAEVGDLPDEGFDVFAHILMEANFLRLGTGGAVIGIDANMETCCLRRRDPLASLDGKAYAEVVETFLNVLEAWQRRLDAYPELADGIADFKDAEAAESRRSLIGEGMIRV